MAGTDTSTGSAWASTVLTKRQRGSFDLLMVVRARTFKSHHPVRRWASVGSRHAHGTVKMCHDGKPTMRDHSDAATRGTEEQNGRYKRCAVRSKPTRLKWRRIQESPSKSTVLLFYHHTQHGNTRDSTSDKTSTTKAYEKIRHMSYQKPVLLVREAVACRRPGTLVNKLESAWLERVLLGLDSKTDEHLIGTPNGMARSCALKRRVQRRRWDTTLLNAMIWDPWQPTPVTRVRSDHEPVLMGPIPRVHFNLPDDPDTATTATAAVPSQETTSRDTNTICHRTNSGEMEAEGAPPVQRTRTTVSAPVTTATKTTSQTTATSLASALVERVGNEAGEE